MKFKSSIVLALLFVCRSLCAQIVLENEACTLVLSEDGYAVSLYDKAAGRECLDTQQGSLPLCTITQNRPYDNENFLMYPAKPIVFSSNRIAYEGGKLYVSFDRTADIFVLDCNISPRNIVFTLERIDYRLEKMGVKRRTEIDELRFLQLPVKELGNFGEWLNVSWDERGGVCLMGLDPRTRIDSFRDRAGLVLWAGAQENVALTGVSAALTVGEKEQLLDEIDHLERAYGLPLGVQSRRREDYSWSYYELRNVTPANIDEHIAFAKEAGMKNMVVYYPDFAYTCGHFLWNRYYPNGIEDLMTITGKIRAAGMKSGFHIHYSKASIDDPYVCGGVPDSRLNTVLDLILTEEIGPDQVDIPVAGQTHRLVQEAGRRIVRIDDELVEYAYVEDNVLKGCRRGLHSSKAVSHSRNALVRLMDVDTWPRFIRLDQTTDIQDEIARNLAAIYSEAGFEFLYFDGAEDVPEPYWYNVSLAQQRVYEALPEKPIYSEGALKSHYGWHILTRGNAFDYFKPEDTRKAMKRYVLPCAERISKDFSSIDFGWVNYVDSDSTTIGMQPDMLEYICSKALAYDSPISLMGNLDVLKRHPLRKDNLAVVRAWEEAKRSGAFTQEQKDLLKDPDREFLLLKDKDGTPRFYECIMITPEGDRTHRAFAFIKDGKNYVISWDPLKGGKKITRKTVKEHDKLNRQ